MLISSFFISAPLFNGELSSFHSQLQSPSAASFASMTPSPLSNKSSPPAAAAPKSVSCEYCRMKFSSVQALQKHTLTIHSFSELLALTSAGLQMGQKSTAGVPCGQCDLKFAS